MSGIIVIGSQWGDEGKGKAVDVFSANADYVIRYQGGSNAGHTLNFQGKKKILHLIPSGIFHSHTACIITSGVALDIETLVDEVEALKKAGLSLNTPNKLLISDSATALLEPHKILDQLRESSKHGKKIGTTGKGIGPAYEDRASRKALLFGDLFAEKDFLRQKLKSHLAEKKFLIEEFYKGPKISLESLLNKILFLREQLRPYRSPDTSTVIYQALRQGKKVLFEGAQGSLLDLLHGTYPYVTSSNTVAGAALVGAGIGLKAIKKVVAITKAYTTRVGEGPFPTEAQGKEAQILQKTGEEWGSTTGRLRRCGWLDLPALKYSIRINGATHLALMKLDVLSCLESIPVCTGYDLKGKTLLEHPVYAPDRSLYQPIYKNLKGWEQDISSIKKFEDLPPLAQNYVEFIQKELNLPVSMISVGPSRSETIWREPLFS